MRLRASPLTVVAVLLAAEAALRLEFARESYFAWAERSWHPGPRGRLVAIGYGLYPLIAGLAGLFTAAATFRRWTGWPLAFSFAAGMYAGVGLDALYWSGPQDLARAARGSVEAVFDLLRTLVAVGGSTACFLALPWRTRLGGPSEAPSPRHPSLLWVTFLSGLTLSLVVAEATRWIAASG